MLRFREILQDGLLASIENERGHLEAAARIDEQIADEAANDLKELQHASAYYFALAALH